NKATVRYNNVSYGKGHGIVIKGNNGILEYNKIDNNHKNGLILQGSKFKINNNTVSYNKARGLSFEGNSDNITNNRFYFNGYNGLRIIGNKNKIKDNILLNNSKKGNYSAIAIKGNNNYFTKNKIQNNRFRGLYVEGKSNNITHQVLKNNWKSQLLINGINNIAYNQTITQGHTSGLYIVGDYNKAFKLRISNNRANGIIIKGNYNRLNRTLVFKNKNGVYVNGIKNILIQNTIKKNNIGIYQKNGEDNRYNYNYIVNEKYNFYRLKGSFNAEYNWWGKNSVYNVKNAKISKYVVARLIAPDVLKLKKTYRISVRFRDNKNKKLKRSIPSLKVFFTFDGEYKPYYYNVTKNIAHGKIRVKQYGFYTLKAKIDEQNLYKYYIGDSKGRLYDLSLYIKKLFKKEGINANNALISQTTNSVLKSIKKSKGNSNSAKSYDDFLSSLFIKGSILNLFIFEYLLKGLPLDQKIGIYSFGKIMDALYHSKGNIWKMIDYTYLTIPGYKALDNFYIGGVPVGQYIKDFLEVFFCIDQNGNMSIGGFIFNGVSLLLTILTGGISFGITSSIRTKGIAFLTSTGLMPKILRYGSILKNIAQKFMPNWMIQMSLPAIKDFSMDFVKLIGGNPASLSVRILKSSRFNILNRLGENIEIYSAAFRMANEGFPAILQTTNSYLKKIFTENAAKFSFQNLMKKATTYFGIRLDYNSISKAINNGPSNIQNAFTVANIESKKVLSNAKNKALSAVKKAVTIVKNTVKAKADFIKVSAQKAYSGTKTFLTNTFNGLKKGVVDIGNKIYNGLKSGYNAGKNVLTNFYNKIRNFKL
ncbi:right-handed parallel beta-helix repeat-containing protein, partial [Methanobrevibacter sp.]|uniref:right-handed parallel beta-helix repeat-containing protein n=1 Tax=Methanobrevibacter sp. TaxID=66852 RepID=UPI00262F4185